MSESQLTPWKNSESEKLVGISFLMTLRMSLTKAWRTQTRHEGAFLDGKQLCQLGAPPPSFAPLEDGAWEMPNQKVVMEAESVPGGLSFPLQCSETSSTQCEV